MNVIFFALLFTSVVKAETDPDVEAYEARCSQYTEGIINLQQDQLNLTSKSCLAQQKYPNDVVKKSESICSLGYLQKKYNALQAEASILFGLKKLNNDVENQYKLMKATSISKVSEAENEARNLAAAVKKINIFHSLLQSKDFINLIKNTKPNETIDVSNFCKKVESPCYEMDTETKMMVAGFLGQYQNRLNAINKNKDNSTPVNVEEDFAGYDKLLVDVPSNQLMQNLVSDIGQMNNINLNQTDKDIQFEKIKAKLAQLKTTGLFSVQDKVNQKNENLSTDMISRLLSDMVTYNFIQAQRRAVTTAAIENLVQNIDIIPTLSEDIDVDFKKQRSGDILPQYQKFLEQSLVSQNNRYTKNLSDNIQAEIDDLLASKSKECPGNIEQYQGIKDKVTCHAFYNKYKDLKDAKDFAIKDQSKAYKTRLDSDYREQLRQIGCLSEENSQNADVLETNKKEILGCLKLAAGKDGELTARISKNRAALDDLNDQIQEIYKLDKYKKLDVLKNHGIKTYFNKSCNKNKMKKQVSAQYYQCSNMPVESSLDAFISTNNEVIAHLDEELKLDKENKKQNKDKNKKDDAQALDACANLEIAARSGIICSVTKKKDKDFKSSEKTAAQKQNYNYKYVDGQVVATRKQNSGVYLGAGVVNAMGTALNSFRNYQNTMAVTNMYKQSAAYSAMAEYNQKNQLYWIPQVPQSYTNPYLYTGAPLGTMDPYSTNFNYNNNSYYYNTSYDPLSNSNASSGSSNNASFGGFN